MRSDICICRHIRGVHVGGKNQCLNRGKDIVLDATGETCECRRFRRELIRESKIENYLVDQAKARGDEVRKVKWIGRSNAPDRFLMALNVWVELKATGKEPNGAQLREHKRMRKFGLDVRVIDSFAGVDALWKV